MKKSHRKDVIIARIIFAAICLVLIGIIVSVILFVNGKRADGKKDDSMQQESQQTQVQNLPPVTENADLPPVTEFTSESESQETNPVIWTNSGVNLREAPNTDCAVITVLDAGTQLELLGEEEGWVKVSYNGQEGYVSVDYITDSDPSVGEGE